MTAIAARDVAAFLKKRNPEIAAVLVYGNDAGSVRERSDILAKQVVSDLKDPFNFIELSDNDLREEPGRLVDEAAALSFAGGERVVRIRGQAEPVPKAATLLVKALEDGSLNPNALVLIEAGALKKTAALRKLFEKSKRAAALPCYEDSAPDLQSMIGEALKAEELTITDEAMQALTAVLGTDRGISRAELEKLILYVGPKSLRDGPCEISIGDVTACLADFTQDLAADIADLAAEGRTKDLSAAMFRATQAGTSAMSILIFLQRHFSRLQTAQSYIAAGDPPSQALKKLRPPVFFNAERRFHNQLGKWPMQRLDAAVDQLLQTEHDAKTTGAPAQEIIERTALRLSALAARAR